MLLFQVHDISLVSAISHNIRTSPTFCEQYIMIQIDYAKSMCVVSCIVLYVTSVTTSSTAMFYK